MRRAASTGRTSSRWDDLSAQQILQIGANIIDQYDSDGYPTRIVFANYASTPSKIVSGVEDIPYIANIRDRPAFISVGSGRWFEQPIVWNPHDVAGGGTPADSPTTFQISAHAVDPTSLSSFSITYNTTKYNGINYSATFAPPIVCEWDKGTSAFSPLQFNAGEGNGFYGFRLPTLIGEKGTPTGVNATGNETVQVIDTGVTLVGIVAADYPNRLKQAADLMPSLECYAGKVNFSGPSSGVEFDLSYMNGGTAVPYSAFITWFKGDGVKMYNTGITTDAAALANLNSTFVNTSTQKVMDKQGWYGVTRTDPRTRRWDPATAQYTYQYAPINVTNNTCDTFRAGSGIGYGTHDDAWDDAGLVGGYNSINSPQRGFQWAYWSENSVRATIQDPSQAALELRRFIHDPDGIVRRSMAGYTTDTTQGGTTDSSQVNSTYGLPLATRDFANNIQALTDSRPIILNRPFKSVAELGYVSRETPWQNLNFSFPESGDSALLDVFRVDEPPIASNGVIAGQVNLNTRNSVVLQALFSGTNIETTSTGIDSTSVIDVTAAQQLGDLLVARTSNTDTTVSKVPIASRAEVVGTWTNPAVTFNSTYVDPNYYFSGFSTDIGTITEWKGQKQALITRKRESAIRALVGAGSARTWNLLIDVVAQTGRFTPNAGSLDKFTVDGEKRYWLHVAIDRVTGVIIDKKLEPVNE